VGPAGREKERGMARGWAEWVAGVAGPRGRRSRPEGKGKLGLGQQAIRPRGANQAFGPHPGRLSCFF